MWLIGYSLAGNWQAGNRSSVASSNTIVRCLTEAIVASYVSLSLDSWMFTGYNCRRDPVGRPSETLISRLRSATILVCFIAIKNTSSRL